MQARRHGVLSRVFMCIAVSNNTPQAVKSIPAETLQDRKENYMLRLMGLKVCESTNCSTSIQEKLVIIEQWWLSLNAPSDEMGFRTAQTPLHVTFKDFEPYGFRKGAVSLRENPVTMYFRDKYKWDKGMVWVTLHKSLSWARAHPGFYSFFLSPSPAFPQWVGKARGFQS